LAVVRASGPAAHAGVAQLLRGGAGLPDVRRCARVRLYDGDELLDDALLLLFAAPRSPTGEDVAEMHLHGSSAVVQGVLEACGRLQARSPMR
jgi:tRNA modification GTPase